MRAGRTRGLGLLGLAWLLATSALAGEPASLRISQALAEGTQVKVYARVSDALGAPVADEALTFHATLGTRVAEVVSSTPFAARQFYQVKAVRLPAKQAENPPRNLP